MSFLVKLSVIVVMFLISAGCALKRMEPTTMVVMDTPSKLSVIKPKSTVQIANISPRSAKGNSFCKFGEQEKLMTKLEELIYKTRESSPHHYFNVTRKDDPTADYLLNINLFCDYRKDDGRDLHYNTTFVKKQKVNTDSDGNRISGHDYLVKEITKTSTAAFLASIAIYEKKSLSPLYYFNISSYDTDSSREDGGKLRNADAFYRQLGEQVIAKIKDTITRDKKPVGAFIPDNGNQAAKGAVLSSNPASALGVCAKLLPLPPEEMADRYDRELYVKLAKANEERRKKGEKDVADRNMEQDLANYYLYLTAKEAVDISRGSMEELYEGYSKIIGMTGDEALITACSHALGRLETKAERLSMKLLDRVTQAKLDIRPDELKDADHAEGQQEKPAVQAAPEAAPAQDQPAPAAKKAGKRGKAGKKQKK